MRKLLGAVLVALLLAPAADAARSAGPVVPPLWATPTTAPPVGSHTDPCAWLSTQGPDRTLRIALPERFGPMSNDKLGCSSNGGDYDEWVYIEPAVGTSLRTYKKTYVDPFVADAGDDSVSDVVYAAGVPVFGGRVGESLSFVAYNDGAPQDVHYVQAQGVRLRWNVTAGEWADVAGDFETATASVGIGATREGICSRGAGAGRWAVTFTLSREVSAIDSYTGACQLILGHGNFATRAIRVAVQPVVGMAATYRRLAGRGDVRRLRRASTRQLDYVVVLKNGAKPRRVRVIQEDAVRLTLTTAPGRWRHDRRLYDDLRASVTTSSSSPRSGSSTTRR